jgi:hypothetical protein
MEARRTDGDVELVCLEEVTDQWGGNRKLKLYCESNSGPDGLIHGLIIDICSPVQAFILLLLLLLLLL